MEAIEPSCNLEVHTNLLGQAIQNAAETTIPVKRKAKKPWISEVTLELADEKHLHRIYIAIQRLMQKSQEVCKIRQRALDTKPMRTS